jgi:uncharacterized tellurite resistance protein B-like protein
MQSPKPRSGLAAAHVLALLVSANGRVDEAELARLEALGAFESLGIAREDFVQMARRCVADIGAALGERSWLRSSDIAYADAVLDAVVDPDTRLLLCRLCAAAIAADGKVSTDERLLYGHMLARWRIHPDAVAQESRPRCVH